MEVTMNAVDLASALQLLASGQISGDFAALLATCNQETFFPELGLVGAEMQPEAPGEEGETILWQSQETIPPPQPEEPEKAAAQVLALVQAVLQAVQSSSRTEPASSSPSVEGQQQAPVEESAVVPAGDAAHPAEAGPKSGGPLPQATWKMLAAVAEEISVPKFQTQAAEAAAVTPEAETVVQRQEAAVVQAFAPQGKEQPLLYALFPDPGKGKATINQPQELPKAALQEESPQSPVYFLPVKPAAESPPQFQLADLPQDAQLPEREPKQEQPEKIEAGFVPTLKEHWQPAVKAEAPAAAMQPRDFQNLLTRATVRVEEKIQELAVKIQPQSLGKVMLQVSVEDGQVVAKFLTENNQAKEVLELSMPQLRETLAKEGLVLQRCEVSLAWSGDWGHRERQQQRQYQRPNRLVDYEEHLTEEAASGQPVGEVNYLV